MVVSWKNNYILGIGKKQQYKHIRALREAELKHLSDELYSNGGVTISDYPNYIIMPDGEVYSMLSTKLTKLKPGKKANGYRFVGLTDKFGNRKYEMIHRLVGKAFLKCKCPKFGLEINHKDGNVENNKVDNLEWVTAKQNTKHRIKVLNKPSRSKKLTSSDVKLIFESNESYKKIGNKFGVCAQTVCNIKRKSSYLIELREVGLL